LKTKVARGNVVMHLRCGGTFTHFIIVNLLMSPLVKELLKLINIW